MKVAIVLFGQPRNYINGFKIISDFISSQKDVEIDFFYHCWIINEKQKYNASPWRYIPEEHMSYNKDVAQHLSHLYNPLSCEYETAIDCFDDSLYMNTLAYNATLELPEQLKNINNTISQIYSRNKARNLFKNYIEKNNVEYDFIMMTRFDALSTTSLNLHELNAQKLYCSDRSLPRKFIQDSLIILPQKMFLTLFDMYDNMKGIINDENLVQAMEKHGEKLVINPENILFAKYLLHYGNTDDIIYSPHIYFS